MRRGLMSFVTFLLFTCAIANLMVSQSGPSFPMNLDYSQLDQNGFAIGPSWSWQEIHKNDDKPFPSPKELCGNFAVQNSDDPLNPPMSQGNPPCSNQISGIDFPYGGHDFICSNFGGDQGSLHGHINWFPAMYEGDLFWEELTPWYKLGDGDYNFSMVPDNQGGITADNARALKSGRIALGIEFDSAEVSSAFSSGWWKKFKDASDLQRHSMVDQSHAVIWGNMGLDSEHFAHSELHPVYAIAIEDKNSKPEDDVWRILVRNWGNEGFCSQNQHYLNSQKFAVLIPRKGVITSELLQTGTSVASKPAGLSWSFAPVADGALVTFDVGPPQQKQMFAGELHIKWTAASTVNNLLERKHSLFSSEVLSRVFTANTAGAGEHDQTAEDRMEKVWEALSPQEQTKIAQTLAVPEGQPLGPARKIQPRKTLKQSPYALYEFIVPPPPQKLATVSIERDVEKVTRDLHRSQAICQLQESPDAPQLIKPEDCKQVLQSH